MIRKAIQRIPKPVRSILRKFYYFPRDALDTILGRRDDLTPPRGLNFVGGGDFKNIGEEFFRYFTDLGHLQSGEHILDVGCGIGRMAAPLTRYLGDGVYEGFDIVPDGIEWCNRHISPKFPNFRFHLADVYNKAYHPHGSQKASNYRFPYDDASFDFAFATSVFTHMLPPELERYFSEIARVLKPRGRCLATFFLLNSESLEQIASGKTLIDFRHELEGCRTSDRSTPESAVAYPEDFIRSLFRKYGFSLQEPIHYGSWSGRAAFLSCQDIIIAQKQ